MLVRLAAAAAVLCTLWGGGGWARADEVQPAPARGDEPIPEAEAPKVRRAVAVIDLSDSEPGRTLADALTRELNNSDELKPLDIENRRIALRDPTKNEDADRMVEALKSKETAENKISDFDFLAARQIATAGLVQLQGATPTPATVALYAQLTFAVGAAKLGERKTKEADLEFRLAHALDPAFKPDGIRYLPDFLQAYEAAIKVQQPAAKITVSGSGRIFLDGRDTGEQVMDSRQTFDVMAGKHVVWLVGQEQAPAASEVLVAADRKEEVPFSIVKLDDSRLFRGLKLALKQAPDPAARAAAMQNLMARLEAKDAVLITQASSKLLIVQTWTLEPVTKDRAPGFSALREYTDKDKPSDVLGPLLPPKKPTPPRIKKDDGIIKQPPPPLDDRHWWQKRKWQAAIGVGAVVVGGLIYGLSTWDRTLGTNPNTGFDTGRQ